MEWTADKKRVLRQTLAELYSKDRDQRMVVQALGLPTAQIGFSDISDHSWFDIINKASNMGRMDALLTYVLNDEGKGKGNAVLERLRDDQRVALVDAPNITVWNGQRNATQQLEKVMGTRNTLVPVRYLALGVERAAAVVRIDRPDGSMGSGFLVEGDLLVTNHHVLENADIAGQSVAVLDFEEPRAGLAKATQRVALEPNRYFKTSATDDWTVVAIAPGTGAKRATIPLQARAVQSGTLVNIIQHPLGGQKMVSVEPRYVAYVGEGRLQYLTDTQPGSSGSPVFDLEWNLVGLHHSGGWITEGENLSRTFYRNEGILIERILAGIAPTP
jgi:V8-like Glu-specific endopeptidase